MRLAPGDLCGWPCRELDGQGAGQGAGQGVGSGVGDARGKDGQESAVSIRS